MLGPGSSPGWRSTIASRGSAGLSPVMSLTSDPAAPPRAIGGRKAEDGRQIGPSSVFRRLCGKAWRRPTLPRLEAQYHRRRGFSRPSSGWDRVLCPSLWPPGRPKPRGTRRSRTSVRGSGWSSAAPDTDPGPSPAGLVGGKRVVWCLLEEGMPPLEWAPAFAGALARPTAPRTCPGSPGLAVLAAGRGVGSRSSD